MNKGKFLTIFFVLFAAAYAIILLISPQLGPTDDFTFLRTLQAGKPMLYFSQDFPYYDAASMGRFTPMSAMEYNFFGLFSKSPSPFWYYFYHAFQFVILMFLIAKLIGKFTSNKFFIYLTPILLSLTPGFAISWFRMQMNERNIIFFLAIFLIFYLSYSKKQNPIYLILGLISANLAIYYKETAFIAVGAFAFSHFILSWKTTNKKIKIFDRLLFLSSAAYIFIYYFHVWLNRGQQLYLYSGNNPVFTFVKNFLNYGFFSDPILILILLPLTIWRIYKVFIQRQEPHPVCDSMLAAAFVYTAGFLALNMYGPYYLLPAYIFALPALIYFINKEIKKNLFWKITGGFTAFLLIFNVFPSGIHYLTYYKYLPIDFNKTLDFLIQDINAKHLKERANIFLDGIDRGGGRATYFVLSEFLEFKGLPIQRFDLKSKEIGTASPLISKISPPFTVFQTDKTDKISSGDYLIVPPQSPKNINKDYLQSLNKDYELVFQTKSFFAFPNANLKSLLKYFLSQKISQDKKAGGIMINENLMDQPDYYVFIKR